MTKKVWKIGNGWNHMNTYGQMVLCEIGPREFDEHWEDIGRNEAMGIKPPYRQEGSYYVFSRKRDYLTAIDTLQANGYRL